MRSDKAVLLKKAVSAASAGGFRRSFRLLGRAAGRDLTPPKDISVFFPADDGRQDLMYEQDFGLEAHAARFAFLRKAVLAMDLPGIGRDLLGGYVDLFLGEYSRAAESLERAALGAPGEYWPQFLHSCALWLLGDELRTRDMLPRALDSVEKAISADPAQLYGYVVRAGLRREMEDVPGRLADARKVAHMAPSFVWARTELAEVLSEEGHYRLALKEANALIRRFPRAGWAWAQRARARGISGYYALALSDFGRALELDPGNGPLRAWRGETFRRLGRYDEALRDLDESIRRDEGYRLAYVWRGRISLLLGRYAAAERDFSAALRLEPREMLARAWRAEARWKLGRAEPAARDYDAIHPAEPAGLWNARLSRGETQENYFMLDSGGGKRERALWEDLDKGTALAPKDPWAWAFRGMALAGAGRLDEAVKSLTRALQLDRGHAWARAWRGESLRRLGVPARALADLEAATATDPPRRWAWAWRGRALADLGRNEEALVCYARATDGPEQRYALAWVWKGEALWALGRSGEARAAFRRAFQLDGKCAEARRWLRRAGRPREELAAD